MAAAGKNQARTRPRWLCRRTTGGHRWGPSQYCSVSTSEERKKEKEKRERGRAKEEEAKSMSASGVFFRFKSRVFRLASTRSL